MLSRLRAFSLVGLSTFVCLGLGVSSAGAGNEIQLVGTFGYGVPADLVVADGKAFVSTVAGLVVLDISDPEHPRAISERGAPRWLGRLVVKGDYAFAQTGYEEIQAIDVSDPTEPRLVGTPIWTEWVQDLQCDGDYLYVAGIGSWTRGLRIIDISDPERLTQVGWLSADRYEPAGVAASGGYAYVAAGDLGLRIVDVADPASPAEIASIDVPGSVGDVWVEGDYAYLAAGSAGLRVIDISEPASPFEVGFLDSLGWRAGVMISGERAYLSDLQGQVAVIDVSHPAHPVKLSDIGGWVIKGIGVAGDYVYVGEELFGVRVFDMEDPAAPRLATTYLTWSNLTALAVEGDLACVTDNYSGLKVIDVTDPAHPVGMGSYDTPGQALGIDIRDGLAFVADFYKGLTIADISDPYEPHGAGFLVTAEYTYDVDLAGDIAYLPAYRGGLRVVDISDVSAPREIRGVPLAGTAKDVKVFGDHLFVGCGGSGLSVLDISDPESPQPVGVFETGESLTWLGAADVSGEYAYVCDYWGEVWVVGVSQPAQPAAVGKTGYIGHPVAVDVSGYYAYVACERDGLKIFDIADPAHPVQVATYGLPNQAKDVTVSGGYVYLASFDAGLYVFKFSPAKLLLSGRLADQRGDPIAGVRVELAGATTDTAWTDEAGRYRFGPIAPGDYILTPAGPGWDFSPRTRTYIGLDADTTGQDFVGTAATALNLVGGSRGYVRPLHGETARLVVAAGRACEVSVEVYTIAGERVWWGAAPVGAGEPITVEWDCRNTAGDIVASGTYLFHVTGCGRDEIVKTIVVR